MEDRKLEEIFGKNEIDFGSEQNLLPIARKVVAQTIGRDLVTVQPLSNPGISQEKLEEIKREVKAENRDRKINSIMNGGEFNEMKTEDHPDYSSTSSTLFYIDYQYSSNHTGQQNQGGNSPTLPIKGNP